MQPCRFVGATFFLDKQNNLLEEELNQIARTQDVPKFSRTQIQHMAMNDKEQKIIYEPSKQLIKDTQPFGIKCVHNKQLKKGYLFFYKQKKLH